MKLYPARPKEKKNKIILVPENFRFWPKKDKFDEIQIFTRFEIMYVS